jgi:hypothetical protein
LETAWKRKLRLCRERQRALRPVAAARKIDNQNFSDAAVKRQEPLANAEKPANAYDSSLMIRENVVSSDLRSVGYDAGRHIMEVEFHAGGIYHYFDVPQSVYKQLMAASSKGRFMNLQIKKFYRCERVG